MPKIKKKKKTDAKKVVAKKIAPKKAVVLKKKPLPKKPAPKKLAGKTAKNKVKDNDFCEHKEDANGFVTCYGSDCEKGKKCTLQRQLKPKPNVPEDPWKDVPDGENDVNSDSNRKYDFRCACV